MARGKQHKDDSSGRGWRGNSKGHAKAGKMGGEKTAATHGSVFYAEIGRAGGRKRGRKQSSDNKKQKQDNNEQPIILEEYDLDDDF